MSGPVIPSWTWVVIAALEWFAVLMVFVAACLLHRAWVRRKEKSGKNDAA